MPSKKPLAGVIEKLSKSITARVKDVTVEKLRVDTNRLADELEKTYFDFFDLLETFIGGVSGQENGSPGFISKYMGGEGQWKAISDLWLDRKDMPRRGQWNSAPHGTYQGLTELYGVTSPLRLKNKKAGGASRVGRGKRPGASKLSFQQYIRKLADDTTAVERFFGPIEIEYALAERSRNFKITTLDGAINEVDSMSKRTGNFLMFPREFSIKSTLTAFPSLQGVQFSEWYVVDYILKRIDPANEKQWVKVNSRYGFGRNRPIRALITPLISWYGNDAFKQVLQKFKGRLSDV